MREHDHHSHHAHSGHDSHGPHGAVMHEPSADWRDAYAAAYEAAVPEPGGTVIHVDLDAVEMGWEFSPLRVTSAWGFNARSRDRRSRHEWETFSRSA